MISLMSGNLPQEGARGNRKIFPAQNHDFGYPARTMSKAGKAKFDFEVAIIGGGSGGYAAARTAASAGLKVAVIEGGEEVGGLCILRGCMPTKALLYASDVLHLAQHGATWGLKIPKVGFDFKKVMARKAAMIKDFADYRVQQLNSGRFTFIRAYAEFVDAHTLALSNGKRLTAKSFVISTGSIVSTPSMADLRDVGYITSDEALRLKKLPKSLIVLGGGAVAVEFAQFFQRFGVPVKLIQRSDTILRDFDEDAARTVETVFAREGMAVYTGTKLKRFYTNNGLKHAEFEYQGKTRTESATEILMALGRSPNTDKLKLANAGVKVDERGRVVTNRQQQSNAKHIYAAGDCTGPYEIVHIAIQQGEIAAYNIINPRKARRIDYRLLTSVVFTDPQIGCVGLTERMAKEQKIPYLTANYPFNDHGKSLIMEAKDGFVKLLANPKTGEILGGSCVGPMGGELIHEIIAAMHKRMTVHELAAMPHYHPTLAEIWTYPAEELADQIKLRR
jgi:pyruvate/2-oxoglutarate dehydrogenase complex dihydrolipoamide dehydrogenase (E3) component